MSSTGRDCAPFAPSASAVDGAVRAYRRLARLAAEVVRPDGVIFQASCSSRVSIEQFAAAVETGITDAGRTSTRAVATAHAIDHPIGFPEGGYLKGLLLDLAPPGAEGP